LVLNSLFDAPPSHQAAEYRQLKPILQDSLPHTRTLTGICLWDKNLAVEIPIVAGAAAVDSWIDRRLHRPLSHQVTRALLHTPVTATQVTLFSLLTGLLAAWCMSNGHPALACLGFALFGLSAVLDHSDGELARATSTESALGHVLDNISDGLVALAMVAGMSWAIAQQIHPDHLGVIGWTISAGLPLCFVVEWRLESLRATTPRQDSQQPILFRIMNTVTSREPLYVFLLIYLMVATDGTGSAWTLLAWAFAGGIHLFWIGLGALGWRFFGLAAMLRGR
jgi:hypothetical protein